MGAADDSKVVNPQVVQCPWCRAEVRAAAGALKVRCERCGQIIPLAVPGEVRTK